MLRSTTVALAVLLCTACDGGKAKPEAAAAGAKPEAKTAEPEESAPNEPAVSEPAVSEPSAEDPLGQRFRDPAWFNNAMFGDKGKRVDFARSEANEAGLFKSHLVFELSDGTTVDDCVSMITSKLEGTVELSREDQPNDRAQLTGSGGRYDVTAVCGEGKGKMRAYVAYEWTR